MASVEESLTELQRLSKIARSCLLMLVLDPEARLTSDAREARRAVSEDVLNYLRDVHAGVRSPRFKAATRRDQAFVERLATDRIRHARPAFPSEGDEELVLAADSRQVQAANFAYVAAANMRRFAAPFFPYSSLRLPVRNPRSLSEFVDYLGRFQDVAWRLPHPERWREVDQTSWRLSFAFWEAASWLGSDIKGRKPLNPFD